MLGHGDGAVVGGAHGDAFDHLVDGHLFALPEPDLAAAHGARVGAGGDHGIRGELTAVELLEDEQQRHESSLRSRGRGARRRSSHRAPYRSRDRLGSPTARRCSAPPLMAARAPAAGSAQQQHREQQGDPLLHVIRPFRCFSIPAYAAPRRKSSPCPHNLHSLLHIAVFRACQDAPLPVANVRKAQHYPLDASSA